MTGVRNPDLQARVKEIQFCHLLLYLCRKHLRSLFPHSVKLLRRILNLLQSFLYPAVKLPHKCIIIFKF